MKPTYTIIFLWLITLPVFAQQPESPWQINAGLNVVDLFPTGRTNDTFPNQGGFLEDLSNSDHWNFGVPSLGIYRKLDKHFSLGINLAFAGIKHIEGQESPNWRYFSTDFQLKYAFSRQNSFSPYLRLGAGISSFKNDIIIDQERSEEKNFGGNWISTIGFDLKLTDKWGFFLESNFKNAFANQGVTHFNHSVGFSYGLGILDQDRDGVPDASDQCKDVPGLVEYDGCPDQDGDGIRDSEDECPMEPGPEENDGCPWIDSDNDTVLDKDDDCPDQAGPIENNGCPWPDSDNDGILDKDDACPEEAGSVDEDGCPVIKKETIEALNIEGGQIFFLANSAKLMGARTAAAIQKIISFMEADERIQLVIEGHTSSDGDASENLILSEKRAASLRKRLIELGIAPDRLESIGYGDTRPIETNDTSEGRARNRRVEFKAKI